MASRILIADDHEMVRKGIRSLLESSRRNIQVIEAGNGREAVERTIDSKPDLVILDISMPLLDGFSAAREIRKVATTPILIFTFEKNETLTELAQKIGISGYITKGEDSDSLLRAIDAAIGSQAGQRADSEIYCRPSMAASPRVRKARMGKENFPQLPALRGEHNRVEKKLQRSEARYRALMGNLAFGICRCGMEGQFVDVNRALVTMLGYESREQLVGLNLTAHIFDDPVKRAQLLGEVGENGTVDPLETAWRRKNGTGLMVRLSGREVNTDDGKRDGYEIIVEDVTKQRLLENQLRQQAAKDPLTGLANYRHLLEVLSSEIQRFNRTGREFALLLFDLDGLKQINDRYGHLVGSEALCRLADVLTSGCRNIDTAARFGGDEFALVLPETGQVQASLVARRIRECFANDGREPKLSVSVGVAIYPDDGEKVETLLGAADTALYSMKDKTHGRDATH